MIHFWSKSFKDSFREKKAKDLTLDELRVLTVEKYNKLAHEHLADVLICWFVGPKPEQAWEYVRLIADDPEIIENQELMKFYSDDAMYALIKKYKEWRKCQR